MADVTSEVGTAAPAAGATEAATAAPAAGAGEVAKKAAPEAKLWVDRLGFGRVAQKGVIDTAKHNFGETIKGVNVFNEAGKGGRVAAFGRVGAVGVGAYVASGALQSKNADGTDRGALHRLGNLVVGGGMMAGGVLAGGRA